MKIALDGEWYDVGRWAHSHPGGSTILQRFANQDATAHFYSLHSRRAVAMLKHMRPLDDDKEEAPPVAEADRAFMAFRAKLVKDGWFERQYHWDLLLTATVLGLAVLGTLLARSHPLLAIAVLGLAMQQGGWLGHDMTHSRNSTYNDFMLRYISGWINGFDRNWWSEKHNTHHVLTNHAQDDPDIHVQPLLFLWAPPKSVDHHLRKYQHYYFPLLYSLLYVSWRQLSLEWTFRKRDWKMLLFSLLPHYIWLFYLLPLSVAIGSSLFGGFLVAIVVTLSHESEEILTSREPSFVKTQFQGTRDILCPDWFTEFLFGGMQYQLEHHLFPTIPRYKYRLLAPIVRQWAADNGMEYKADPLVTMLRSHVETLRRASQLAAREIHGTDPFAFRSAGK